MSAMSFDADALKSPEIFNTTSGNCEACSMIPLISSSAAVIYSFPS
jgi:hypothetical protein